MTLLSSVRHSPLHLGTAVGDGRCGIEAATAQEEVHQLGKKTDIYVQRAKASHLWVVFLQNKQLAITNNQLRFSTFNPYASSAYKSDAVTVCDGRGKSQHRIV
jgi:hypothetical protein